MEMVVTIACSAIGALRESVLLQAVRGLDLGLERASSGDTSDDHVPELGLNICLVCEVFVQILATAVGTLAFIWATVVLLGGFSTSLHKVDFWVITGIVFIEAAKVVGLNSSSEANFVAQVPPAFLKLRTELLYTGRRMPFKPDASGRVLSYITLVLWNDTWDFISFLALLAPVLLSVPLVAASNCIGLSIFRLLTIISHKQYRDSGADDSKANMLRALIFFYALVLAQGGLFLLWLGIVVRRIVLKIQVCSEYHLEGEDDRKLIDKYVDRTSSACIKTGVVNTVNRKLVSFAIDLLHSEYSEDRISGAQVLHTLTSVGKKTHIDRAIAHIQSSPDCIARMFVLLSSKSGIDENSKVKLALIVTKISKELRLGDIDRATESISSLIDPYMTMISTPVFSVNSNGQQQGINKGNQSNPSIQNDSGEKKHPLIIHGLMILAKLAGNPENCTRIFSNKDLFSKIMAPISNELYTVFTDIDESGTAIGITENSLRVVSKLVKGTDNINRDIRQEICRNRFVLDRIHPILLTLDRRYNSLKVPAIKILSVLDLVDILGNDRAMVNYIHHLMSFLDDSNEIISIKKAAAKVLVMLATDSSTTHCATIMNWSRGAYVVQQLSRMLPLPDPNTSPPDPDTSPGPRQSYRNAVAQLLTKFCVHSTDAETRALLKSPDPDTSLDPRQSYRNAVAQLLTQFCVHSTDAETRALLKSILHEVLNVIISEVNKALGITDQESNSQQRNRSPAAEVILQLFSPCIDTSRCASRGSQGASQYLVGANGGNGRPAPANQSGSGNTLQNQTVTGSQNPRQDGYPALGRIPSALGKVIKVVMPGAYSNIDVKTQPASAPIEAGSRKTLVAFLELAFQICDNKLSDAAGLDAAVAQSTQLSDVADLVDKLGKIIGMCNKDAVGLLKGRGPLDDYLMMFKSATKLCAWVVRSNSTYAAHFRDKGINQKLQHALDAMRGLELGVLLTYSADELKNYKTLSSIVEDARSLMDESNQATPSPQPQPQSAV